MPSGPSPRNIIRLHSAQISALAFSPDNQLIYSGDASGTVCAVACETLRPICVWKAHNGSLLGIEAWDGKVVTQGRDNKLHVWSLPPILPSITQGSPLQLEAPTLLYSLDVNALNYCRFSLLKEKPHSCIPGEKTAVSAFLAVPNLVDSNFVDVWELPSLQRVHAAIGKTSLPRTSAAEGRNTKTGIVMSMHLYFSEVEGCQQLRLFAGYEDGSVILHTYTASARTSTEGLGWDALWTARLHRESVMHLAVSPDLSFALTVSADHIVGRYSLKDDVDESDRSAVHRTKHPGNSAITIRSDSRICAVAGWDGSVRLYSTKTFKPLGTLEYHRDSCYAIAFATLHPTQRAAELDMEEMVDAEKRTRWLVAGGKDTRVSIWELMDFDRKRTEPPEKS